MVDVVDCVVIVAGVVGWRLRSPWLRPAAKCLSWSPRTASALAPAAAQLRGYSRRHYYSPGSRRLDCARPAATCSTDYCAERYPFLTRGAEAGRRRPLRPNAATSGHSQNAIANGVGDLRWIDRHEMLDLEPEWGRVRPALSVNGIVDSHALMLSLQGDLEAAAEWWCLRAPVISVGSNPMEFISILVGRIRPPSSKAV